MSPSPIPSPVPFQLGPDAGLRPGLPLGGALPRGVGGRGLREIPPPLPAGGRGCSSTAPPKTMRRPGAPTSTWTQTTPPSGPPSPRWGPALREAAAFAPGIRILRQEPWEALCSFIISQNNHIPRIKGILHRLCQAFGQPIGDTGWQAFPTPQRLGRLRSPGPSPPAGGLPGQIPAGRRPEGRQRRGGPGTGRPPPRRNTAGRSCKKIFGRGPQSGGVRPALRLPQDGVLPPGRVDETGHGHPPPRHRPRDFGENAGLAQQYLFHYSRPSPPAVPAKSGIKKRERKIPLSFFTAPPPAAPPAGRWRPKTPPG